MSFRVRPINKDEKGFYDAIIVRSTSSTYGAPYMTPALFALTPFVIESDQEGVEPPIYSVDAQARVYMDFKRIQKAGVEFAAAGLIHEANHVFRNHFDRFRNVASRYSRDLVNIAEDCEINDDLFELAVSADGEKRLIGKKNIMKHHYPEIDFSPVHPALYGLKPNDTAEAYLYALQVEREKEQEEQEKNREQGDPESGENGQEGDQEGQQGDSPGEPGQSSSGGGMGQDSQPHSGVCGGGSGTGANPSEWELGAKVAEPGTMQHSGKSPGELEDVRVRTASQIQEWEKSYGIGSVPAGLSRAAQELLGDPQVTWKQEFKSEVSTDLRMKRAGNREIDRSKRNRRYANVTKIIYPGTKDWIPRIGVGVDTSMSMGAKDLGQALTELESLLRMSGARSSGIQVFSADSDAYPPQDIRRVEEIQLRGGGGTDMMKCFDKFDELKVDIGVILTDGIFQWDKTRKPSRNRKVIIVVINDNERYAQQEDMPPGAKVIHVRPSAL